jgi:hypothetical protein
MYNEHNEISNIQYNIKLNYLYITFVTAYFYETVGLISVVCTIILNIAFSVWYIMYVPTWHASGIGPKVFRCPRRNVC